jgi:hypothetical protein
MQTAIEFEQKEIAAVAEQMQQKPIQSKAKVMKFEAKGCGVSYTSES